MADDAPAEPRRASAIAGRGWFSASGHPPGDVVVTFDHDVATADDFGPLNHSCDPNLGWASARTLVTLRAIEADEELTVDYATAVVDPGWSMYCHCDTYRCRQVIEGGDWTIPQLQRRYAGRWAPHVRRLIEPGE